MTSSNLQKATDELIIVMKDVLSSEEEVNNNVQKCLNLLESSSKEDILLFMARLFELSLLKNIERAGLATTICGYLVEKGVPSDPILEPLIDLINSLLDKSRLFYEILKKEVEAISEQDEDAENKKNKIFTDLINDRDVISEDCYNAVVALNKFYPCAISVFSINNNNLQAARKQLAEKVAFVGSNNQATYWIDRLFNVLSDEPIIVIDLENRIGFRGKMSGIVDNYQLQHLLMSLPVLNGGKSSISEENLSVANGTGPQSSENVVVSKWNMYNLELCKSSNWQEVTDIANKPFSKYMNCWIWGEGTPKDITVHNNHRVVLLSIPSYERSTKMTRTFKNLKAEIIIEKELSKEEINEWLNNG